MKTKYVVLGLVLLMIATPLAGTLYNHENNIGRANSNTPPSVSITVPSVIEHEKSVNITLKYSGGISSNGRTTTVNYIEDLWLYVDGKLVKLWDPPPRLLLSPGLNYTLNLTSFPNGAMTLYAKVKNTNNEYANATATSTYYKCIVDTNLTTPLKDTLLNTTFNYTIYVYNYKSGFNVTQVKFFISNNTNTWLLHEVSGTHLLTPDNASYYTYLTSPADFTNIPDGNYTLYGVIYDDNATWNGWNNETGKVSITLDKTAPSSFNVILPSNLTYTNNPKPTFTWGSSSDLHFSHYALQLSANANFTQIVYDFNTTATSFTPSSNLADGTYYWRVIAWDGAGNYRISINYYVLTIDTIPPDITTATLTPYWYSPNGNGRNDTLYINAAAIEEVSWDVKIYNATNTLVGDLGSTSYQTTCAFTDTTKYASDGQYHVLLVATDQAGKVASKSLYFYQDTTPLAKPTLLAPANNAVLNNTNVELKWNLPSNMSNWNRDVLVVKNSSGGEVLNTTYASLPPTSEFSNTNTYSDGTYTWTIYRYDKAQNLITATATFVVDTTPPTKPVLQSPANNKVTNASLVNFTWLPSIDDTNITYHLVIGFYGTTSVYLNVSTIKPWYVVNFTSVEKQEFWWYVIAYDSAGHLNRSANTFYITIDHEPPKISMTVSSHYMSPNGNGVKDNITINGTSLIGGDVYKWKVEILNSSGVVVKSYITSLYSLTFSWLWDGKNNSGGIVPYGNYTIILIAYDTAGNQNCTLSWVVVDTIPPSNPELLTPAEGSYLNHAWANITWNWTDTNITQAKIHILNSTGEYYSENISLTTTYLNISLPDGNYSVYIEVWDIAGNENITPYRNFVIDTTPPSYFSLLSPSGIYENAENVTLTWNASADINFGYYIVAVHYNGTYHNYTTTATSYAVSLPSGEYAVDWYVVAMDKAGNSRESNETYSFYHDTIAPRGIYLKHPANNSILNNMTINFTWSYAVDFSAVHYIFEIYNASGSVIYTNTTNNNYTTVVVANGNFSWRVIAVDEAENKNATPPSSFSVNTIPPRLEATALNSTMINGNITVGNNITLNITTNGVKMRIESGSYDSGWINYTQYFTLPFNTTGLYNITIYVKDRAGNSNSTSMDVYLDAAPPSIWGVSVKHYLIFTNTTEIGINATDDTEIKDYGYEYNGTIYWFSTSQFNISLPDVEGNYTLTLYVSDIFGHVSTANTWIYEVQHRPTGSISVDTHLTNNASVALHLSANDTVFSVVGMYIEADNGAWSYYNYTTSVMLQFTTDGNHTIYVKYITNLGVKSNIYSTWIVVDTAPPTTNISGVPAYTNASAITFTLIGNDSLSGLAYYKVYYRYNGGAWTYFGTYLPNQTSVEFTFAQAGTYEFSVIGYDKAGKHEAITVKATTIVDWTHPTLTLNGKNETLTNIFYFNLSWNATDNTGIAYYLIYIYKGNLTRATPWKVINTTATSISIRLDDNATYIIEIRAYDDAGNYVQKSLKVSENYNYPPDIKNVDIPQNATAEQGTTFYADAYDVKGDALNYTWLVNNKTAGYGQYLKYTFDKAGNYTIVLIVSDGVHKVMRNWTIQVAPASSGSNGRRVGTPDILVGLILPILLLIGLLLLILLIIVFMMNKRKKGAEERDEELSEGELAILNEIKRFLEQHNGEKIDTVLNAVANKMQITINDVLLILDYGVSKGIFTKETDADGNMRVFLASKNIKLVESAQKEKGGE